MLELDPIELNDEDSNVATHVLDAWINEALEARLNMEEEWREDLRTYEGIPKLATKNFPWPGASNLEVPMKAIVADAILARLHNQIFGYEWIWKAQTQYGNQNAVRAWQDFLTTEAHNRMKLKRQSKDWEFESVLLGTGWLKGLWIDERRWARVATPDGATDMIEVVDHFGPWVDAVPIEDIIVPPDARAVNGPFRCQWIAHVCPQRWDELKAKEVLGYRNLDRIENLFDGEPHAEHAAEVKEERDRAKGVEMIRREAFDIYEIWCNFPIYEFSNYPYKLAPDNSERFFAEMVFTYHKKTGTLLRVMENWLENSRRPFLPLRYTRRTNSVYGRGVGRMIHALNQGLNTVHNQRIDNSTVANTRVWKALKGAVPRSTQISPSKIIWVDDMDAIEPMAHGDVYSSSRDNEMILRDYIERRTGVVDYTLGKESPIGKYSATATSTLALLREGTKKFDFTLDDWREDWGELADWLVTQYKQYGFGESGLVEGIMGPEAAAEMLTLLDEQVGQPSLGPVKMDLMASTAADSKEAQQQQNAVLFDITERVYGRILELVSIITRGVDEMGQPITAAHRQVAIEAIQAALALYRRILHSAEVKDLDAFMPNVDKLEEMLLASTDPNRIAANEETARLAGGPIPQGAPSAGGRAPAPTGPAPGGNGAVPQ